MSDRGWKTQERRYFIEDYKEAVGCVLCGESNPIVLRLHHIIPLRQRIRASLHNHGYAKIIEELELCTVLCANCHLVVHDEM
jgi:5-methylcytosine-specific restriction endonuclease McrA